MKANSLTTEQITSYGQFLRSEERSPGTVEKYLRDVRAFVHWLDGKPVSKEAATEWKEHLIALGYTLTTINSMLAALNGLFRHLGWELYRLKFLRIQRRLFRDAGRELSRAECQRLLTTVQARGQARLALLMETLCATGIRVSEVAYITVEAAQAGRAEVALKGKIRTILIPSKLARKLLKYAQTQKNVSGEIFLTGNGKRLSRRQIWAEMKRLCKAAGAEPSRVFPHNLRHLFAAVFYKVCKDLARLADVLGHSSIETTRLYLVTSGVEHARQLNRLGFVT